MRRRERITSAEIGPRRTGTSTANIKSPKGSIQNPKSGKNHSMPPKMQITASGMRTARQLFRRSMSIGRRNAGIRRDSTSNCR
jgi:hypothetical protein